MNLTLSPLLHTWLIDVDGTTLLHNGYLQGEDTLLPGVKEFWATIPAHDIIVLLSARTLEEQEPTLDFFRKNNLRFNHALFGLPVGERILINDTKPSGLQTAIAVNVPRDAGLAG